MCQIKIPEMYSRALVVAIPKRNKPLGDTTSYHPILLLCVPFKILERLIYVRVEPIIDPLLPQWGLSTREVNRRSAHLAGLSTREVNRRSGFG